MGERNFESTLIVGGKSHLALVLRKKVFGLAGRGGVHSTGHRRFLLGQKTFTLTSTLALLDLVFGKTRSPVLRYKWSFKVN